MPTELEQQLPRWAEALDREAPTISIDEILRRPTVAVDVDRLEPPARDHVVSLNGLAEFGPSLRNGDVGDVDHVGDRDAPIELAPTRAVRSAHRRRIALRVALATAAAGVVALAANVRTDDETEPVDVPASTIAAPPSTVPLDPFEGVWLSTDTDGSSQTMKIVGLGTDTYRVVIHDQAATTACAGGASTLSGVARLVTATSLVIAQPELTCDDGTIPPIGPAPQAQLADYTLDLDTATGEFVDTFGVVWQSDGSIVDLDGPATESPAAGGMWPQSTLEEVRAAQELADAGDPAATWQLEPELVSEEFEEPGRVELVEGFLREVLGWEAYVFHPTEAGRVRNGEYVDLVGQRYLRCAEGRTNPLYPPDMEPQRGQLCAPTLDALTYETVSLDLAQLDRRGADGIWVVKQWRPTAPFAQADPTVVEAQGRERLEEFLAARIAGDGAEGRVRVDDDSDVPLLYASTSGAPYERYDIESVGQPQWPNALMTFSARLFTVGDTTVVEQQFNWVPSFGLWLANHPTTENGEPIVRPITSSDGEVSIAVPDAWHGYLAGKFWNEQDQDMWIGSLSRREDVLGSNERIELVDPVAYDAWCADNGGSPLLTAPANAAGIAQQIIDDPNFDTAAPVAASIGGVEAVSIDVALAPGGEACGIGMIDIPRWIHTIGWDPGWRLRLYLVDLPDGMSVDTLAITVVAPDERFDEVIAETAPIIESIEFHPQSG